MSLSAELVFKTDLEKEVKGILFWLSWGKMTSPLFWHKSYLMICLGSWFTQPFDYYYALLETAKESRKILNFHFDFQLVPKFPNGIFFYTTKKPVLLPKRVENC